MNVTATAPAAVRSGDVRVDGGPRLHYLEQGSSAGGGETIVFLHGWPDSSWSFSRVLPLLPEQWRAVAVDLRGFGDSERPESGYSIPELAADVVAFLDALRIERATIVGHSFGSFVARQVAIAEPQRVAGLILIGTGFRAATAVTRQLQKNLRDLPSPVPVAFARHFQTSTLYRPIPHGFFEELLAESLKLPSQLWRLTIDRLVECDDTVDLERIGAPTLLLWGDRDELFSRTDQERFVAALSTARLKIYGETGHCPNWECPDEVAADIADFVGRPT